MKDFYEKAKTAIIAEKPLTVEFLPVIELHGEGVLDPGMRASLVDFRLEDDEHPMYVLEFDMTDFMVYNKPHEQANWYVNAGNSNKMDTARNTGNWPKDNRDKLWIDAKADPEKIFKIVGGGAGLYTEYQESGFEGPYVQWLEDELTTARNFVDSYYPSSMKE